ncbi:cytochrome P450 [Favolaschia claudopus]|uniref:Cytochrome P450 n=1 Tax=Favolaschia claudopus TaxID=2862362 RepID=A0AAW0BP49_9AGAR
MDHDPSLLQIFSVSLFFCKCFSCFYRRLKQKSIVALIPGPPSNSWIFGHMKHLLLPANYGDFEYTWQKEYGPVYRIKGCFGEDRLMLSDPLPLQHVLNTNFFTHGPALAQAISLAFDDKAVMGAHGSRHKRLRAATQVGFTASAVRGYQPLFERVARRLTEQLEKICALYPDGTPTDMLPIIAEASLNSMSQALLSYSTEELGKDFVTNNAKILSLAATHSPTQLLASAITSRLPHLFWRLLTHLPGIPDFDLIRNAKVFAKQVGWKAIREKLTLAAVRDSGDSKSESTSSPSELESPSRVTHGDVFDFLLNICPTSSNKPQKSALTHEELASQTGTFFIAGEETTTSAIVFALLELAKHQSFQDELRAEVHHFAKIKSNSEAGFSYDNMPLLNALIKESLRINTPGAAQERAAIVDTVLPLSNPIRLLNGEMLHSIPIRKGQVVTVAAASYHRNEVLWGDDAHKFRPSRWLDGTAFHGRALGPYANLLSFLGGQRVCLGWRFALAFRAYSRRYVLTVLNLDSLLEMQVLLFELVEKFRFTCSEDERHRLRAQFANTLMPVLPDGTRGAPLVVTRC